MNNPDLKMARTSRSVAQRALMLLVVGLVIGGTFWKSGVLGMFFSSENKVGNIGVHVSEDALLKTNDDSVQTTRLDFASMSITEKIVGTWTLSDADASRVIVNRTDGAATINVTFGLLASFLYGSKLQLDLEWTFENDLLTHTIVGGSPEGGKKALIRDFGEKTVYKILKLTEEEMLLREIAGEEEEYLWKRSAEG